MSIPDETLARWAAWPRPGTPGPWTRDGRVVGVGRYSWRSYTFIGRHEDLLDDAAFIAHAPEMREAIDVLVAEVRVQQGWTRFFLEALRQLARADGTDRPTLKAPELVAAAVVAKYERMMGEA